MGRTCTAVKSFEESIIPFSRTDRDQEVESGLTRILNGGLVTISSQRSKRLGVACKATSGRYKWTSLD